MPRVLSNIRFRRVALVDKGANFDPTTGDGAHIVLYKRDLKEEKHQEKSMKLTDLFKSILGAAKETDAQKRQAEIDRLEKALDTPGSPESIAAAAPPAPQPNPTPQPQAGALNPEHKKALADHRNALGNMINSYGAGPHADGHPVHAMKAMHGELCKLVGVEGQDSIHKDGDMTDADVQKRVDTATAELNKRLADAEKALTVEVEKREDAEMLTLLKSFTATPFNIDLANADNDVTKFRKMKKADPAGFDRMVTLFKAAEAQIATNNSLRKQMGSARSGGNGGGTAEQELQKIAEGLMAKAANGMSKEQAFEQACLDNPAIVKRYREEQQ